MTTADDILRTSELNADSLFPGDADAVSHRFRQLAAIFHPDHSRDPRAGDVFVRLCRLRDAALGALEDIAADVGAGAERNRVWHDDRGGSGRLDRLSVRRTATGAAIVCKGSLVYTFPRENRAISDAETVRATKLPSADAAMAREMKPFLPAFEASLRSEDGWTANVFARGPNDVLLADLAEHCGGSIEPVHAAWIVSGLLNIVCYLEWAGLMHGAIAPDTVLIDPSMHSVRLVGGWGLATAFGQRAEAIPDRTLRRRPDLVASRGLAIVGVDGDLVRETAREILGTEAVADEMRLFLRLPPEATAVADYAAWDECLAASFGPKRFVVMPVAATDVYPGMGRPA